MHVLVNVCDARCVEVCSIMDFTELLTQSLKQQSNIDDAPVFVEGGGLEVVSEVPFEYYVTTRVHKTLLQYTHKCQPIPAYTSIEHAIRYLTWVNSWGIVNIVGLEKMPKLDVIDALRDVFLRAQASSNQSPEIVKIYGMIYQIFVNTINTTKKELFDRPQSYTHEQINLEYTGESCLSELLTVVNRIMISLITFQPDFIQYVPLVNADFCGLYVFQFCMMSLSVIEKSPYYNENTIAVNIFGMLIVDILTDVVSRNVWLTRNVGLTHSIMQSFYMKFPAFKRVNTVAVFRSSREYHNSILTFIGSNPVYGEFNLYNLLASANFPETVRLDFMLEQFAQSIQMPTFGNNLYADLTTYVIELMQNENATNFGVIYDERLFTILLRANGVLDLIEKHHGDDPNTGAAITMLKEYSRRQV